MMKSIYKLLLVVTGVAMFGTAVAGEQSRYHNASIYGRDYSYSYNWIDADSWCNEYPDGMGGTNVSGSTRIRGYIDGAYVNEYVSYYGDESCPNIFSNFGQSKNQDFEISLNGVTVEADCSAQIARRGSGTSQYKYPGQKPQNYNDTWSRHDTANGYDSSCVITATNSNSGDTGTYDYYNWARQYESFSNRND